MPIERPWPTVCKAVPATFTDWSVTAILAGTKDRTRREAWRRDEKSAVLDECPMPTPWQQRQRGDLLWVREAFARRGDNADDGAAGPDLRKPVYYRQDIAVGDDLKWRSPLFLDRRYSRITLRVAESRLEPLQDITDEESLLEGIRPVRHENFPRVKRGSGQRLRYAWREGLTWDQSALTPREAFEKLWCEINGRKSWLFNPQVVVCVFHHRVVNVETFMTAEGISEFRGRYNGTRKAA